MGHSRRHRCTQPGNREAVLRRRRLRLLADTHIVLWRMTGDKRLAGRAIALMDDPANSVEVSAVSVWEVAVKHSLSRRGKPGVPFSGTDFLGEVRRVGIEPFGVTAEHVAALDRVPLHHRDPFDRLLIAQATQESMHLLTHDAQLGRYGDFVIVV
ncbi:MAG: type II toxin-antitoxin system VapC family toxin [Novosphingobium sp.]|nr:type II toxin-antitoxin system VapC family toxin [Novosphingobium sp.]